MAHLLRPESKEALDTGLGQLQSFKREQLVSGRNYRVTMGGQRTGFVEFNLVVPLPAPSLPHSAWADAMSLQSRVSYLSQDFEDNVLGSFPG